MNLNEFFKSNIGGTCCVVMPPMRHGGNPRIYPQAEIVKIGRKYATIRWSGWEESKFCLDNGLEGGEGNYLGQVYPTVKDYEEHKRITNACDEIWRYCNRHHRWSRDLPEELREQLHAWVKQQKDL